MAQNPVERKAAGTLSREGKITALLLLKNFYDEEVFNLLVKEFYNSDIGISEAAIRSSGALGNEIAISHLYQIVERGKKSQRIIAIQSLMAVRAPSSTGMLIKYFNHFPEEDVRAEILRAINTISPTAQLVQELNNSVYVDPKQSEAVKCMAVEALVEAERYPFLKETLPRAAPAVQQAAFVKMLQTGSQVVLDFSSEAFDPAVMGSYLCLYTLKARNPQANYVLEELQKGDRQTILAFLHSLSEFQGRLRFPARVFRLLLITPYVDVETEAAIGDFLKKIVLEVKGAVPQLVSEFSVITSAHLDTVFAKIRKNYISLKGIQKKEDLISTVLATLLEKYATPSVLADVQAFFKEDGYTGRTPPVAQMRSLLASAPKEDQNRLDACIPLFTLKEKKDKQAVLALVSRVDLNRPFFLRRLNRLIRVAGALEIKTTSKKIQEILDFARAERIQFIEETSIVTLCQLLTRSIIELSREYFKEPTKNLRSLNGYIRGARFIPAKILIAPLIHIAQVPALNAQSRALVVETLEHMEKQEKDDSGLSALKKVLPPLLKVLDMKDVADEIKLRIGDILARNGDSTVGHQALDLTVHSTAVGRRVAVRMLKSLVARGAGAAVENVTNRLYQLLEDPDRSVKVEALIALLAMTDDYAAQIVGDYIKAGDVEMIADILGGVTKPPSRETFSLLLDMLRLDSLPVQQALRAILPELSQGSYAEELRQGLLAVLSGVPRETAAVEAAAPQEILLEPQNESMLGQAKAEFKFKRENTQILTVFFIDIYGSTEISSKVEMSSYLKMIKTFEDIVTSTIAANRGTIVKKMGDGILAHFRRALNATVAALTIQQKIRDYSSMRVAEEKFQARIGLNTGPVIKKDRDIFGETVNVAARMQSAATPGEALLTHETFKEIHDYVRCTHLGPIQVKGIKDGVVAYKPEEIVVDIEKILQASPGEPGEKGALRDASLEKLKESMFVPKFQLPGDKGASGEAAALLKDIFSEFSRYVEETANDYHDEYNLKKYLQENWNKLMETI
jgi:class 3 adenylate cyclase